MGQDAEPDCARVDASGADAGGQLTAYFDGACPLCAAEIRYYADRAEPGSIRIVDVARDDTLTGDGLDRDEALRRFHVRRPDGTLVSGAAGFAELWGRLPGWHWLARIARLPGVSSVLEVGYRMVLPVRPVLSRLALRLGARAEPTCTRAEGSRRG